MSLLPGIILRFAESRGVRAVLIKGQTLSDQGLRPARQSGDVDIWVDPEQFDGFRRALAGWGWNDRDEKVLAPLTGPASVFVVHSVTLMNDEWPVSIDLHRCYPGFFTAPNELFNHVWNAREPNVIGHQLCAVPHPTDHWLLAMLHATRDRNSRQLEELERAANDFDTVRLQHVRDRALTLGAAEPLRQRLARRGITFPPADAESSRLLDEWRLAISPAAHGDLTHVNELLRARGKDRLAVIRKAIFPPETTYRLFHDVRPGKAGLLLSYARRGLSGILAVPRMVRYAMTMRNPSRTNRSAAD
ncbi:nucleotidyltransferase family protein [Microbacterium sp. NPDC016588]